MVTSLQLLHVRLGRQKRVINNYVNEQFWYIISNNTDSKFAR